VFFVGVYVEIINVLGEPNNFFLKKNFISLESVWWLLVFWVVESSDFWFFVCVLGFLLCVWLCAISGF